MSATRLDHWMPYEPSESMPWDLRRVVHLHRRAAFSATWSQVQQDLESGPTHSIEKLLNAHKSPQNAENSQLSETIASAAIHSNNPDRLKAWWIFRMLKTNDPLGERLTLMWHNHFATSNRKVKNLKLMYDQNQQFRTNARKNFLTLLSSVIKHPAMLIWLDGDSNKKGKSNENLARELLELFTIGIGNFTEKDVKESARALTGWTVVNERFENRNARHDNSELKILGRQSPCNGDELLEHLMRQPETATRIAWRLCHTFMGETFFGQTSTDKQIDELSAGLIANDFNIGWAVETILKSQNFFSAENIQTRIIGPVEYAIGAIRSLELQRDAPSTMVLARWLARMGQDLFYPPNVGGWKEGRSWLNSRTIIARSNFASALADGAIWHPEKPIDLDELYSKYKVEKDSVARVKWLTQLLWGSVPEKVMESAYSFLQSHKNERAQEIVLAMLLSRSEHLLG